MYIRNPVYSFPQFQTDWKGKVHIDEEINSTSNNDNYDKTNKKNDDTDITIYLWLDKIHTFTAFQITKEQWDTGIVVIQENFLVLRWRRNVTRCFSRWLRSRIHETVKSTDTSSTFKGTIELTGRNHYSWTDGGK